MTAHEFHASLRWTGSTGLGWEGYDRTHVGAAPPAEQELHLTTGERHGDPRLLNPEQLVVMAASSCQMLWFLHLAAKARVDVVHYEDEASGVMPEDRLTRITLRPRIVVVGDAGEERVLKLAHQAHERCYVANSLRSDVLLEPRIECLTTPGGLVRLALELNNEVDLRRLVQGSLETLSSVWHPDCEFESALAGVEGRTYRGFAGIRDYADDLLATFSDWKTDVEEVVEVAPDAVAAVTSIRGHGREGVPFERSSATAWHLREGKIVRVQTFWTREEALAAARAA